MELPKNNCSFCKHLTFEGPNENFEYDVRCILKDERPEDECLCNYFEKEHSNISHCDLDEAYNNFLDLALRMNFDEYAKTNYYKILKEKTLDNHKNVCSICESENDLDIVHLNLDNLGRETINDTTVICKNCYCDLSNNKKVNAHNTIE